MNEFKSKADGRRLVFQLRERVKELEEQLKTMSDGFDASCESEEQLRDRVRELEKAQEA